MTALLGCVFLRPPLFHLGVFLELLLVEICTQTRGEEHLACDGSANRACGDDKPHDNAGTGEDLSKLNALRLEGRNKMACQMLAGC